MAQEARIVFSKEKKNLFRNIKMDIPIGWLDQERQNLEDP